MSESNIEAGASVALDHGLRALRDVLWRHPIAVQAAFASLAAEGREFAKTPEGKEWQARLEKSELFDRLRFVWKSLGMHAFVERPGEILPSFFLEVAVRAAASRDVESLISSLFDR